MKIHKTSIPIDQFYEPFFCFLPDVNFPTSGSTPAQIPMWGLLLGLSVKSLHVGSQGQTRRDEGSRPLRGGSVIERAQFVSPIHACFSFGACTIQSRRFWLSSSHFAISNIFVLACILSMRRLVSNRSQMLSSVSKPVAFIGSSSPATHALPCHLRLRRGLHPAYDPGKSKIPLLAVRPLPRQQSH